MTLVNTQSDAEKTVSHLFISQEHDSVGHLNRGSFAQNTVNLILAPKGFI
jgi:hypothetical protein